MRRAGVAVSAVVVGLVGATLVAPAGVGLAQDDDCVREERVIVDYDENGNPIYEVRTIDTCDDDGDDGSGGDGPDTCHTESGQEVPCSDPVMGWWSSSYDCYVTLQDPQPPEGDEAWEGNDPDDGSVYLFHCLQPDGSWRPETHFLTEAPALPSPTVLAQQAVGGLALSGARVGIAPSPDGVGLVGVPVWLWTDGDQATVGPIRNTVSVPGLAVTAEANATRIEWNMGDGNVVVCDGPGRPYHPSYGAEEPDCGHTYSRPSSTQPDGRYTVVATTTWHIEWWVEPRGSGLEDEEFQFRDSEPVSIQINELQVVTG